MAKRKNNGLFEILFEFAAILPWWVGTILAIVAYGVLHRYASIEITLTNVAPNQVAQIVVAQMVKALTT